ncbi:MAG: hypothetical protein Q7J56_03200, partial [Deltaproteobacteria bacterium]|nr:hypothetical protein [Deltaproteobacteria bacterium]
MSLTLDQHSTDLSNTTSTGLLLAGNLAFSAVYWRVDNDGTVPVRFSLRSTGGDSGGYEVKAGESREFQAPGGTNKFSLTTSSSSTE